MNMRARVYGVLVGLHPAAFRDEFGLEMRLDFEEAVPSRGAVELYWDAAVSVGRQWVRAGVASEREVIPMAARFLLEGRYGAIGGEWMSPFEFGRGTVLAVALFGGLVSVQGHAPRAADLMNGGDAGSAGARSASSAPAEVRPVPDARAASAGRLNRSGMKAAPAAEMRAQTETAAVRAALAAFVPTGRIGEMSAAKIAEARATLRLVDANGRAALDTPPFHEAERMGHPMLAGALAVSEASEEVQRFEVVSIREDKSGPARIPISPQFGPTQNGYRMEHLPMLFALRAAYLPSLGGDGVQFSMKQMEGIPEWLKFTSYVINAKVSEADLADWQNPALQPAMMRARLQSMLAERLGLVVHRATREASVFEMTVARGGPRFKPAEAVTLEEVRKKHPNAFLSEGTIGAPGAQGEFTFFNMTMPVFAATMSNIAGRPLEDKTGLTGRYDITYRMPPPPEPGAEVGVGTTSDNTVLILDITGQLGLKLQPAKGQVETLVIDHIEKPTDN